jgi:hypothetical protein
MGACYDSHRRQRGTLSKNYRPSTWNAGYRLRIQKGTELQRQQQDTCMTGAVYGDGMRHER